MPIERIWVDADACPRAVKDILYRAAQRRELLLTLVANQPLQVPRSRFITSLQVAKGFDVADNSIVQRVVAGDLVVTADIPLAADVIAKGALTLSPRGDLFTEDNIRQRLSMRDFMDCLRGSGVDTGGPSAYSPADAKRFADQLDRLLA